MIFTRSVTTILCALILSVGAAMPLTLFAYKTDTVSTNSSRKDFVVGPGKIDITIPVGQSKTIELLITNRMGDDRIFNLNIEDFTGSDDANRPVVLLGDQRGPYSLKDYLHFEEESFELKNGQRVRVPVTITIPFDEEPGGRYGSVLVSTVSKPVDRTGEMGAAGGAAVVSRIGTLFFVRIPGDIHEDGELEKFTIAQNKKVFTKGPIGLQLFYKNKGSIHLNPYGEVRITNILGDEVGFVEIEPWYTMPDTLRLREVQWNRGFMFGRYKATANINRGYDDVIDTMSVTFYVLPWKIVGGGVLGLTFILLFFRWLGSKFELKRK